MKWQQNAVSDIKANTINNYIIDINKKTNEWHNEVNEK